MKNYYGSDAPAWDEIVMPPPLTECRRPAWAALLGRRRADDREPADAGHRADRKRWLHHRRPAPVRNRVVLHPRSTRADAPTPRDIEGRHQPRCKTRPCAQVAVRWPSTREAIQERLMLGLSEPAGELAAPADVRHRPPTVRRSPYDPGIALGGSCCTMPLARRLLECVLGTPNDPLERRSIDGPIAQAVAQDVEPLRLSWSVRSEVDARGPSRL